MNSKLVTDRIIEYVGGRTNIKEAMHCFTRLRLYLYDSSLVKLDEIKELDGVVGAQFQNEQLQVIIGHDVDKVYQELEKQLVTSNIDVKEKKQSIIDSLMTTVSNVFTPILPAIIGAGLMKGILPLLVLMGLIKQDSGIYNLLNIVADTSFNFLPFLVAVSASRRFKVNEYLAIALAGALFYPTLSNPDVSFNLFSLVSIPKLSYVSTVIPIVLGVYLMSIIYHQVDRFVPKVVKMIFTPLITLLLSIPLLLIVIGPIGSYIGSYLAQVSVWLSTYVPVLYGLLLGSLNPLIVMTGMHYAFFPIMFENVAHLGFENGFLPISVMSNMAMAGATLAVLLFTKDKKMKEVSLSSGISAIFGITEPALYGVALKLKAPLYATMISGGIVSAVVITLGVKMYTFISPSILALTSFYGLNGDLSNLMIAVTGVIVAIIFAFILSYILLKKMDRKPTDNKKQIVHEVYAPITGQVVSLSEIPDETFSSGLMGKGLGIIPDLNATRVTAPFDGTITSIAPSKHAIGITSTDGIEVLIHIGLESVYLNGEGFDVLVKLDQRVKKGESVIELDRQMINQSDTDMITPVIILNAEDYLDIIVTSSKQVEAGQDRLIMVI